VPSETVYPEESVCPVRIAGIQCVVSVPFVRCCGAVGASVPRSSSTTPSSVFGTSPGAPLGGKWLPALTIRPGL
jgi:hypothetical protein